MAKFKVGDRVRRINSSNGDGMDVGTEWVVAGFEKFYADDYLVFDGGRRGNADNFEPVAVAPATATLTIEAGKFYKTRDGRKVGPMAPTRKVWTDLEGDTSAFDDESGHYYTAAGLFLTRYGAPDDNDLVAEWVDEPARPPAAVAEATAAFKDGDRVRFTDKVPDYWWFKPGQTGTVTSSTGGYYAYNVKVDGADKPHPAHVNAEHIELLSAEEPAAPAPTAPTVNLDLEFVPFPQVGDAVLIPGVISAINESPRGTNYNIVFETQNRRMSLHFLEEDFILDEDGDDEGDCPCANNDNGPAPSADTAKAFDALGDWLRSLAVSRAA